MDQRIRGREKWENQYFLPHFIFYLIFFFISNTNSNFPSFLFCLALPIFFECLPGDWIVNCYVSLGFKRLEFWKLWFLIFTKLYSYWKRQSIVANLNININIENLKVLYILAITTKFYNVLSIYNNYVYFNKYKMNHIYL